MELFFGLGRPFPYAVGKYPLDQAAPVRKRPAGPELLLLDVPEEIVHFPEDIPVDGDGDRDLPYCGLWRRSLNCTRIENMIQMGSSL